MHRPLLTLASVLLLTLLLVPGTALGATKMVPKTDNFVFFVDHSGSMAQAGGKGLTKSTDAGASKISRAKGLLSMLNQRIPSLDYDGGLALFAPYDMRQDMQRYSQSSMAGAVDSIETDYPVYGRQTPMGTGLQQLGPDLESLRGRGKTSVIIVSDGENNWGPDPVTVASNLYRQHGGDLCFHVISMAHEGSGAQTLREISQLNDCSVMATYDELMGSEQAMASFVQDVFYAEKMVQEKREPAKVAPAPQPEPEPEPAPQEEEVMVFRSVTFAFDSAALDDEAKALLDEAAMLLEERSGDILLEGHTDSIGTESYNMELSKRRAKSVMDYFVESGISAQRIETKGYGESRPKYDNNTRHGRSLNRRVEINLQ
jgi:OOP family OmpA-OmpF porin